MPRKVLVQLRMTPEERDFARAKAAATGHSLSDYLRTLIGLQALNPQPPRLLENDGGQCRRCGDVRMNLLRGLCPKCVKFA